MDYLPLFFDLRNQPCLLIGGGKIALRKAELLVAAGAKLRVVAPQIDQNLAELVDHYDGELYRREAETSDLRDCVLMIAASDDAELNRRMAETARLQRVPVNVVDDRDACSVILPTIIDRSPVLVAISSGGESPVLSRTLRSRLEAELPTNFGELARFLGRHRERLRRELPDLDSRRRFWEQVVDSSIPELILTGRTAQAEAALSAMLDKGIDSRGEVWLVGAGPGDPDLLTLRALRLMQAAEVVLYDRLVSDGVLKLVRRDAERIYVGKRRDEHIMSQPEISTLLVEYARRGKRVLRLKGGDPFLFGRGGEEIETLAEAQVTFQVVPGITAATGCSAYAGIPLTHRDYAQSVRFLTGHLKEGRVNLDWGELVQGQQTLVFYMASVGLAEICAQLIHFGQTATMPAALIERGTLSEQRVICGTLATLPGLANRQRVRPPTLLIVGEVVKLRDRLNWFTPAGKNT